MIFLSILYRSVSDELAGVSSKSADSFLSQRDVYANLMG